MTAGTGARLSILAAALLFSTGGAAIKGTALDALQVSCFRSGIAALVLGVALRPLARRLPARVWLVGAGYAGVVTLFVVANKLTTAAHTIYLQSTAPIFVIALSPRLLGTRIARADVLCGAALFAGIALLVAATPAPLGTAPDPALGNAFAIGAGLCWALTLIGLSRLARSEDGGGALDAAFAGNLIAWALALPALLSLEAPSANDLLGVAYLGVFQVALAYLLLARGMRGLSAVEVSLLLLLEPLLNPFWTWWLHGETLAALAWVGCALILAACAGRALGAPPASA